MSTYELSVIMLGSYTIILTIIAIISFVRQNQNGYIIGNRNLGAFSTICSMLAGQFNGGGVFIIFTFGILFGYGLFWFALGFFVGYLILSLFANTVNEEGKTHNDINVPDILKRRIGPYTHHFSSFIIIGKACLFGTAQLLIAGTIIAALFDLPNAWGICLTAAIIAFYVYLGGYLTVVKTDIIQWVVLFCVALCAALFFPKPSFSELIGDLQQTPDIKKWGFFLFTFTMILSNADVWQRILSAKSGKIGKQSLLISGLLFIVFTMTTTIIVKSWNITSANGFFSLFKEQLLSPATLAVIGTFTLIAVMSTIDTQVQLFSSALSKNVFNLDIDNHREKFVKVSRLATIILLASIAIIASTLGSTVEFILKAFSFSYILAPVMITSMIWGKRTTRFKDFACIVGLVAGLLIYIYMFFNGHFSEMINNVIPATVTAIICALSIGYQKIKGLCSNAENILRD